MAISKFHALRKAEGAWSLNTIPGKKLILSYLKKSPIKGFFCLYKYGLFLFV
ncbi:hypothetical protein GGGNBK_03410 [Sporosarcina sp. ANT_H38]